MPHTPGPWTYSLRSEHAEISQPGGLTVCHLPLRLLDINTSVADAVLISLAPEMLAAAIDAIETFERDGMMGSPILRLRESVRKALNDPEWTGRPK